jgi:hypothetical protein
VLFQGSNTTQPKKKTYNQQGRQICQNRTFLGRLLLALSGVIVGGPALGEWLIGDVSVLGVHVQVRVLSELAASGNEIGTRET